MGFLHRFELKRAIRISRKTDYSAKNKTSWMLVIPPLDEDHSPTWIYTLKEWLENKPAWPVKILATNSIIGKLKTELPGINIIEIPDDQIKKNRIPTSFLKDRLKREYVDIAVLLSAEEEPLSEILFALCNANLKAAFWNVSRDSYATYLLRSSSKHLSDVESTKQLLRFLDDFKAGGYMPGENPSSYF